MTLMKTLRRLIIYSCHNISDTISVVHGWVFLEVVMKEKNIDKEFFYNIDTVSHFKDEIVFIPQLLSALALDEYMYCQNNDLRAMHLKVMLLKYELTGLHFKK